MENIKCGWYPIFDIDDPAKPEDPTECHNPAEYFHACDYGYACKAHKCRCSIPLTEENIKKENIKNLRNNGIAAFARAYRKYVETNKYPDGEEYSIQTFCDDLFYLFCQYGQIGMPCENLDGIEADIIALSDFADGKVDIHGMEIEAAKKQDS